MLDIKRGSSVVIYENIIGGGVSRGPPVVLVETKCRINYIMVGKKRESFEYFDVKMGRKMDEKKIRVGRSSNNSGGLCG